jgi:hypothetical protein
LELGRADQAGPLLQEAYDIWVAILRPDHPNLIKAAGWLATFLMKRAAQGDAAARAQAAEICARHGLSPDQMVQDAARYPDTPPDLPPDADWPWVTHPPDPSPLPLWPPRAGAAIPRQNGGRGCSRPLRGSGWGCR